MIRLSMVGFLVGFLIVGCVSSEVYAVRAMEIGHPDFQSRLDGVYEGSYAYGSFQYLVAVTLASGRISAIDILRNRTTAPARKAEGVIARILAAQSPDVDAVAGATTTSKALMKAVENALVSP